MSVNIILIGFLLLPVIFVYLWICIKKPFWVVAVLAVYLPFEQFLSKWYPDILYAPLRYLGEATIFFLLIIYLFDRVMVKKKRWAKTPIDFAVIILLIAILLSSIVNSVPAVVAVLGVKNLLRYIALFYLTILINPSETQIIRLFKFLFAIAIFQAILAILQAVVGKPAYEFFAAREVVVGGETIRQAFAAKIAFGSYRTMVFGTMERYNILGNYVAMWLGISGAVFLSKQRILNVCTWHIVLLLIVLVLSYSRMSWLAFIAGGVTLFAISKKNKIIAYVVGFFAVFFTVIMVGSFSVNSIDIHAADVGLGGPLTTRYLSVFSSEYIKVLFYSGRGYSYFSIVPEILRVSPVFGLGPGMIASDVSNLISVPYVLNRLTLDNPYALRYLGDAGFATVVAQLGLVGVVAVLLIFWQLFRSGFNYLKYAEIEWRPFAVAYIVIIVMTIVFNILSFSLIYRVPSYYFWMFSAFLVLRSKTSNKRRVKHRVDLLPKRDFLSVSGRPRYRRL